MPLYEYHCSHCDQDFEKMVRFSEADQTPECPYCQGQETHKRVSSFATHGSSAGSTSTASSCSSSGRFT